MDRLGAGSDRRTARPVGGDEERLRFEEGSMDAQSPDGHG